MTETYAEKYSVTIERDVQTSEIRKEIWRSVDRDLIHRLRDLPAVTEFSEVNQKPVHFEYRFQGRLERENGPALQVIDAETGVVVREEWYRHGERHRSDGAALIIRDSSSGEITYFERHVSKNPLFGTPSQSGPR